MPIFKFLDGPSPYLKNSWRAFLIMIFMLPLFYFEWRSKSERIKRDMFAGVNILKTFIVQFFGTLTSLCQIAALNYTFSSHVLLFSGMISIVLLIWKIICRKPVTYLELAGIAVSMCGSFIMTQGKEVTGGYSRKSIIIGDLLSFLASILGAISLQMNAPLMQIYTTGVFAVISNIFIWIISIACLYIVGGSIQYNIDSMYGAFGFLNPKNIIICVFGLGILVTYGTAMTFYYAIRFLSPLLISITYLVQPMLAQIFCNVCGIEVFPGMFTIIGGFIVLIGLFLVVKAEDNSRSEENQEKSTEMLVKISADNVDGI